MFPVQTNNIFSLYPIKLDINKGQEVAEQLTIGQSAFLTNSDNH